MGISKRYLYFCGLLVKYKVSRSLERACRYGFNLTLLDTVPFTQMLVHSTVWGQDSAVVSVSGIPQVILVAGSAEPSPENIRKYAAVGG